MSLIKRYNKLCDELHELIRLRKAPKHAARPAYIDQSTAFSLDVDNGIWNNRGLDGDDLSEPPLWLVNDGVCADINALLMLRRCDEEECYLIREFCFMQNWYNREWAQLNVCIERSGEYFQSHSFIIAKLLDLEGDVDFLFYLKRAKSSLLYAGALWWKSLKDCGLYSDAIAWGPSDADFGQALEQATATAAGLSAQLDGTDTSDTSVSLDFDDDVLQELELLRLGEGDQDEIDAVQQLEKLSVEDTAEHPPFKRARFNL